MHTTNWRVRAGLRLALGLGLLTGALLLPAPAQAARCTQDSSGNWNCTWNERLNWYWCNGYYIARRVRWQVPEGTPPSGGWRMAFFYNGTSPADTNPFVHNADSSLTKYGAQFSPQIMRELLDDPGGSGKKYAVVAPEPPQSGGFVEFWHTNSVYPYSASCDYDFFPDFFAEIKNGNYGANLNMQRRFGYGISSGGYNSSRMAVTFNHARQWYQSAAEWDNLNDWQALGIIAASYATCAGSACSVPSLPSNHPPTKFWHGTADDIVPISTAQEYYDQLGAQGITRAFHTHGGEHELNASMLGTSGVKSWFDQFY